MYLTPIFYPISILPDRFQWLIYINPVYYLMECFRAPLYLNQIPEPRIILGALISASAAFIIGSILFTRKADQFAYYL
jgi:ABC-type polysaccharide/polyol phosphate export permease